MENQCSRRGTTLCVLLIVSKDEVKYAAVSRLFMAVAVSYVNVCLRDQSLCPMSLIFSDARCQSVFRVEPDVSLCFVRCCVCQPAFPVLFKIDVSIGTRVKKNKKKPRKKRIKHDKEQKI